MAAKRIQSDSDVLLVAGIGGSYLGARAAIEFLRHGFYNEQTKDARKTPQIYYIGNSMNGTYIQDVIDLLEGKDFSINVISKSGTTTETAIAFRVFRELLIKKYGLNHISTGDVLRSEIKQGTELGKTAKGYIDQGQLIPDELMIDILANVYDSFGADHAGVIFDGFPRTIPQAEALKEMLAKRGHKVAAMIELAVPEDELMKRLLLRGQQSGRSDDNEETIRQRLSVYHNQTSPLIDWYENEGLHRHIDGLGDLDRIFADICKVVEEV